VCERDRKGFIPLSVRYTIIGKHATTRFRGLANERFRV
jgi:hypothetical protein